MNTIRMSRKDEIKAEMQELREERSDLLREICMHHKTITRYLETCINPEQIRLLIKDLSGGPLNQLFNVIINEMMSRGTSMSDLTKAMLASESHKARTRVEEVT